VYQVFRSGITLDQSLTWKKYCTRFLEVIQWLLGVAPGQKICWFTNS